MEDLNLTREELLLKINELQSRLAVMQQSHVQQEEEFERLSAALQRSREQIKIYLTHSPLAIIDVDEDFVVRQWAGAAEKIFGWSAAETTGKPLPELKLFYEQDIPNARRTLEKLKGGNDGAVSSIFRNFRKDREVVHCEWFSTILRDQPGNGNYLSSMIMDITEKRLTELQLRKSEERLNSTQEVASVGSWETDLLNYSVTWTEETYRIFELDRHQFGLSHPDFLNYVHPDDRAKANSALFESLGSPDIHVLSHRIITPGGTIKFVEERWRIIFNEEGRAVRALGTCRDITSPPQ